MANEQLQVRLGLSCKQFAAGCAKLGAAFREAAWAMRVFDNTVFVVKYFPSWLKYAK
jgi:hypothetical protein